MSFINGEVYYMVFNIAHNSLLTIVHNKYRRDTGLFSWLCSEKAICL